MKSLIIILSGILVAGLPAIAQKQLHQVWTTDTILPVPESVLCDAGGNTLYVSLVDGNPSAKDGRGGVMKLDADGHIKDSVWITGLNAPKGLGRYQNKLYVADLDEVVVIDIKQGKITQKIPVAGAAYLNDITVDRSGNIYVSDSRKNKIFMVTKGAASLYLDNVENANGLLITDEALYVLSAGRLLSVDEKKKITTIASGMEKSTDGLVQIAPGEFIVSCWAGVIYYVKADGSVQQLQDFRSTQTNTADLGYNVKNKTLYVPTFFKKTVIAYHL